MKTAPITKRFWAGFLRLLSPGFSCCGKCKKPWKFVDYHETQYRPDGGCFSLCEKCWAAMTPEERLPYYKELWLQWTSSDPLEWKDIETAVLSGK